jgi:two-component system response regulator PilR (NtrC family)
VIERAVALEPTAAVLPETLPEPVRRGVAPGSALLDLPELPDEGIDLEARVEEIYRDHIAQALKRAGGVQVKAAELLGMSFRSFRYYAKKFNVK